MMRKHSESIRRGKAMTRFTALLMLLLLAFPTFAFAKDWEEGRLTLRCATTDGDVSFRQETFRIYLVGNDRMNLVQPYAAVVSSALSEPENSKALAEYIKSQKISPTKTVTTDGAGEAKLTLDKGVYLVIGEAVTYKGTTLYPQPLLLKLDWKEGNDLTGYVKYNPEEPNKPNTPPTPPIKTGDPPVLNRMMLVAMLSLIALLMVVRARIKAGVNDNR